ncbi:toprim domain-containing protein [Fusobacterium necrophorum]|uniref:Toprim domain-containing protein n=1 Tax=Fusobacterium necrophorum TaxID=859 RepID=A0AAW6WEZ8_9FUSO|nr:toprim domain-containing protein [Fusobacterium necrophorum]MDK4481931.1 toprim domain-containing protein [Fusobacterium necrophorum]MDK4512918.1 toprim domain-containing protein [Fusobacterium necrophorum]MDK4515686.1 toprim domain-containing protein [Fusobacterium necrophorum]
MDKYKRYGNELRFDYCPICKKESSDNPHFSINLETKQYYCHSTGRGGSIEELEDFDVDLENISIKKEKKIQAANFDSIMKSRADKHLGEDWLTYLKGRGISEKGLDRLVRLGRNNTMMIPITDGQHVVAIKYRTIDKKMSSEKGSQSNYLVNWQNIKNKSYLIIVEGEIDLLSAIEAGYDNVVSLPFGAKNLKAIEHQKTWIESFSKITIAVDNDEPGRECKEEIVKLLKTSSKKLYEVELGTYKDFNEILCDKGIGALKKVINKATKIEVNFEPFYEEEDGYYCFQKENYSKCTDFTLNLTGYSDNYIVGIVKQNGREREFKAKKTDLLTKNGMLEHLGYYLGSSQSIAKFWSWFLDKKNEQFLLEIPHYGIIDEEYYDRDSQVICSKVDLKIQNISEIEKLNEEEKKWLNENLLFLRKDVNQSLLGICWALGRFHVQENYPILEVSGTTSIGKTEYVEFISRILFGNKENIKSFSMVTNHQIRSLSSCSNITPWVIDEVKITGKNLREKAVELYSTIRAVYDNKTLNQGNTTNKLTEFPLCTPLIISGETELSDVSIKNRMISTSLTKQNKSEDDVFFVLKDTKILEKLGKTALKNRLSKGKIEVELEVVKKLLSQVKDERQIYNGKCLLIGLKALSEIINITPGDRGRFINYLNELLANEYNVTTNFLELLELVADSGMSVSHFYQISNGRHFVRFNLLYKAIAEEHFKTNSTLELLDARTLKKQLIENKFILNSRVSIRFPKTEFLETETAAYKAEEIIPNGFF